METLDYDYDEPSQPSHNLLPALLNILTVIILLGVLAIAGVFLMIFFNPNSSFNPFPPPTLPAVAVLPTATETREPLLPPTWTPTQTVEPTLTPTPRPTGTLPPTSTTFTLITVTPMPSPTVTPPVGGYPFAIKDRPFAVPNIAHPDEGCNWAGVAGQVLDMSGGPKTQLMVVLGGTLNGKPIDPLGVKYSLTGVAPLYGQAGYEFVLGDKPVASKDTLWIQLVSQSEVPLSEKVYFSTFADCQKNLIVISFKQGK